MLPQLKLIYDIINASDDGFGLPIKGIIQNEKIIIFGCNDFHSFRDWYWLFDF